MRRATTVFLSLLLAAGCAAPATRLPADGPPVLVDRHQVALGGYDPVTYFEEGGGKPLLGDPARTATYQGAVWRFATEPDRQRFLADPARYAPAFGGWCAWAMADGEGSLVAVDPRSFLVQDGKLLLFYDGPFADTRASWRRGDTAGLLAQAERNWKRMVAARGSGG